MINKKSTIFRPTPEMKRFLEARLNMEIKPTITAECEYAQIDRTTYYLWIKKPDFVAWLNEQWELNAGRLNTWIDKVGYQKGVKDFRYFELMQTKRHKYQKTIKQNIEGKITITDILNKLQDNNQDSIFDDTKTDK